MGRCFASGIVAESVDAKGKALINWEQGLPVAYATTGKKKRLPVATQIPAPILFQCETWNYCLHDIHDSSHFDAREMSKMLRGHFQASHSS